MEEREFARYCTEILKNKKADDIKILDLRELTTFTDFFVICSAESPPHSKALVNHLQEKLDEDDIKPVSVEGFQNKKWVVLDFTAVIVHIFLPETRNYYRLEDYWGDAEIESV